MNETYIDARFGVAATITQTEKGFVVCCLDSDADEGIVGTKIFQDIVHARAYALGFTGGRLGGSVEI